MQPLAHQVHPSRHDIFAGRGDLEMGVVQLLVLGSFILTFEGDD